MIEYNNADFEIASSILEDSVSKHVKNANTRAIIIDTVKILIALLLLSIKSVYLLEMFIQRKTAAKIKAAKFNTNVEQNKILIIFTKSPVYPIIFENDSLHL